MILFYTQDTKFKLLHKKQYISWIENLISIYKKNKIEISFIFCSDPYLLDLNRRYLRHDYCTDVISFNYDNLYSNKKISGDIFISIDTVQKNAKKFNVTSFDEELLRVMAHGLFHLLGYKDDTNREKLIMRKQEDFAIKLFKDHLNERKI